MARRVLFILLSVVVFLSSMYTGFSYYKSQQAEQDYRRTLIQKAKIGEVVEKANQLAKNEKDARKELEKQFADFKANNKRFQSAKSELERKIISLEAQVEEEKIQKVALEESLKDALGKSKSLRTVSKNSGGKLAELENKISKQRNKFKAQTEQYKKDIVLARKAKEKAIKAHAEVKKSNLKTETELKQVRAELDYTQNELKKAIKAKSTLEKTVEVERRKVVQTPSDDKAVKELDKIRKELKLVRQQLADEKEKARQKKRLKAVGVKKAVKGEKSTAKKKTENPKKAIKVASLTKENASAEDAKKEKKTPGTKTKKEDDKKKNALQERARIAQEELKRLGCYSGKVDGVWGKGSFDALNNFGRSANLSNVRNFPSKRTIEILKGKTETVCALDVKKEQNSSGEQAETAQTNPYYPTLREQCLASCVGAFEPVQSCRDSC